VARSRTLAIALVLALFGSVEARADRVVWRVQAGDMLSALAIRFGVTVDELRAWNGLEGDRILVGQELVVARGSTSDSTNAPERVAAAEATRTPRDRAERARRAQEPTPDEPSSEPTIASDATSATTDATGDAAPSPTAESAPTETRTRARSTETARTAETRTEARTDLPTYVLQRGDTLSHVARRHDTTVEQLLAINPGLRADRVSAGRRVHVPVPEGTLRIEHVARSGETLARLAERHRVSVRDLVRWNPGIRRGLRAGRTVVIWSTVPASVSASVGAPNRGRLLEAEPMPPHPGYYVRDPSRSFGTLETVLWMQDAVQEVLDRHPRSPRIRVHDVSLREGGFMNGHRSHQSGRDVDISLYQRRCADRLCPMRNLQPDELDVERTFTLLEHWLKNDRLEAVFLDYSLQAPLYEEGRRRGYSRAQLSRWFQYPHGPAYPLGVVRHYPRHRDHAHVRFACPDTDDACR
jgi:LysM repeat protein